MPADLKIPRTRDDMTARKRNSACAACHDKSIPLNGSSTPGEDYFDHYDLAAVEDRDLYPDGRYMGVRLAQRSDREGITWCHRPTDLKPNEARYTFVYAFFLAQAGDFAPPVR